MTITFGTKLTADSDANHANIVELTSTTAVVVYDDDLSSNLRARVITLSGSTLSTGAEQTVFAGHTHRNPELARLSDTAVMVVWANVTTITNRAVVLTISGDTITPGTVLTLVHDFRVGDYDISALDSTNVILVYRRDPTNVNIARILSVSGTTITENAAFTYYSPTIESESNVVVTITSSKAVVVFLDGDNSVRPTGQVLDVSGTTITGNANAQLSTVVGNVGNNVITKLDSNKVLVGFKNDSDLLMDAVAVSESGGTLTPGTTKSIEDGTNFYYELSISGTTITIDDSKIGQHGSGYGIKASSITKAIASTDANIVALDETNYISQWEATLEVLPLIIASSFSLAPMTKPADVDASGTFIYIALLEDGVPILTKISTILDADGTTVFNPSAGTNIGVQCGRSDVNVVWVAGNFGGTDVVEKSEDAGSSFSVKDPATFGNVTAFVVGPQDDRVILADNTVDIQETDDDGVSWTETNSAIGFPVNALAVYDQNSDKCVLGNDSAVNDNIDYSANVGVNLEDYSSGFPQSDITSIVVR